MRDTPDIVGNYRFSEKSARRRGNKGKRLNRTQDKRMNDAHKLLPSTWDLCSRNNRPRTLLGLLFTKMSTQVKVCIRFDHLKWTYWDSKAIACSLGCLPAIRFDMTFVSINMFTICNYTYYQQMLLLPVLVWWSGEYLSEGRGRHTHTEAEGIISRFMYGKYRFCYILVQLRSHGIEVSNQKEPISISASSMEKW